MVIRAPTLQAEDDRGARWSGTVALVAKPGGPDTGVGRYVQMLQRGLESAGVHATRVAPVAPPLFSALYAAVRHIGLDLRAFLLNYPIWAAYPPTDVHHLTSQNLATLLFFRRPQGWFSRRQKYGLSGP